MPTLPVEYRHRVVQLTEEGYSTAEIAEVLGTSPSWARSIKALHQTGEPLAPKSKANRRRPLADREGDRIRARVREKPGTTLDDLRRDRGLKTSISNLWAARRALGLGLKKSRSGTVAEVEDAFGAGLDWVTPIDARNYFGHAGYPPD